MGREKEFKIEIKTNKTKYFLNKEEKEIVYYINRGKLFKDHVTFHKGVITIEGKRTNIDASISLLATKNSTYFHDIVKSLIYMYFLEGEFIIKDLKLFVNNEQICSDELNLIQDFSNPTELRMCPEKIFGDDKTKSDKIEISLMNLILSFNKNNVSLDYTWRSFNCLYVYWFKTTSDTDCIIKFKKHLESEEFEILYPSTNTYLKTIDDKNLIDFSYREFIIDSFKKGCKLPKIVRFFKDFEDYRICKILKEKITYKKKDIEEQSNIEYERILRHYDNMISNENKKDTDIVRMLVCKLGYYYRCKLFHGENKPVNFLLVDPRQKEMDQIASLLKFICKDIIENSL